jgi:hypothetical protein
MAQSHRFRLATLGHDRAAWLSREERPAAGELTGERRVVDGSSWAVWERRGLVQGRLDGFSSLLPGSGGPSVYAASGSKS